MIFYFNWVTLVTGKARLDCLIILKLYMIYVQNSMTYVINRQPNNSFLFPYYTTKIIVKSGMVGV